MPEVPRKKPHWQRAIPWYDRLWVRIYAALVIFTLILATIGVASWELLRVRVYGNDSSVLSLSQLRNPSEGYQPKPPESAGSRDAEAPPRPPFVAGDSPRPPPFETRWQPFGRQPPLPFPVVMFFITSIAMLLVAYPVARWLARSIERISGPIYAFGQGDLSARAPTQAPGEVGALAREFNEAADRVQALVRSQQSLLANASHELRSPLARIQLQLEQIGRRSSSDIRTQIRHEITELDALVDEILLSSKLQSQHRFALQDEVELLALTAEECARVGGTVEGELATVRGDERLLRRVLRNMLENAVRYSGESESVEARVRQDGEQTVVDVLDRGPGVPEQERERIFEPFYRARGAAEKHGGVGLGLALSQQIVQEHGGSLQFLSREGGGGHIRLTLPRLVENRGKTG